MSAAFHSDVAHRIARSYDKLSPGHRQMADFILGNSDQAALLNNFELASACHVSTATATRFARAIGYGSYSEFRESQLSALRAHHSYAQRLSQEIDEHASHFDVVRNGMDQDLENLQAARDRLDEANCGRTVDLILGADRIFAFGTGLSQYVIGVLVHGLEPYCRGNVTNIGPMGNGNTAIRRVVHCTPKDLVITCSLPHYAADTIEVSEIARDRGAWVVCVTDRPTSPLPKFADATFYAEAGRRLLPNSITSAVAIAEGLVAAVANRRREGLDVHRTLDARHDKSLGA